jgi:hypothetical protein
MEKIQDFLKPRRGQTYQQGYYNPKNPAKYVGDITKIVFRSSWEFKFLVWCDNTPQVLRYSSEPISIPYMNPVDRRVHQYFIDMWVEILEESGKVTRWLVEIKPERNLVMPKEPKNPTTKTLKNHLGQVKRVMMNLAKFQAARNFAKFQNMKFGVLRLNRTSGQFEFVIWEKGAENGF